jgi:hypothetical protein
MDSSRDFGTRLMRTALLVALLFAQSLMLVHEVGHFSAGDSSLCAVCQVGHGLAGAVVDTQAPPLIPCDHSETFSFTGLPALDSTWRPALARAPPETLSA